MDEARRLEAMVADFKYLTELPRSNLIHAALSLRFYHPSRFPHLWSLFQSLLTTEGIFTGSFFEKRQNWAL